ncbi:MAG: UDP-glucose 4-epimerase GalE [Proteobacteria bacterium]|nr:UDP-glucose 4-epimerase GalE [Pseudomonadota bacterium]
MGDKILVVGGAGYIGAHVVNEFIKADYEVAVLDNLSTGQQVNFNQDAQFIHGDIQDRFFLEKVFKTPYKSVVHLAAAKAAGESMLEPEKYSHQNIIGSLNLIEAVSNAGVKNFIFSSTAAVYGEPEYLPIDEQHPLIPTNYYGFTKLEIEKYLEWYEKLKGIRSASLRYFNAAGYDKNGEVKGLEKNPANLIPIVMEVAAGMREELLIFGGDYATKDGTGCRDYIHVTDLAIAHVKAHQFLITKKESLSINLGTGNSLSVLDIVNKTEEISKKKIAYKIVGRRQGDPAELYAISKNAKKVLNWEARSSDLDSLIRTTWDRYRID